MLHRAAHENRTSASAISNNVDTLEQRAAGLEGWCIYDTFLLETFVRECQKTRRKQAHNLLAPPLFACTLGCAISRLRAQSTLHDAAFFLISSVQQPDTIAAALRFIRSILEVCTGRHGRFCLRSSHATSMNFHRDLNSVALPGDIRVAASKCGVGGLQDLGAWVDRHPRGILTDQNVVNSVRARIACQYSAETGRCPSTEPGSHLGSFAIAGMHYKTYRWSWCRRRSDASAAAAAHTHRLRRPRSAAGRGHHVR